MSSSKKKLDSIRKLLLGDLYKQCNTNENGGGVERHQLDAQLAKLKLDGCLEGCNVDDLVNVCQLSTATIPACMRENDRTCAEGWFQKQRNPPSMALLYREYVNAKMFEDDDDDDEDEGDEQIECPICNQHPTSEIEMQQMKRSCGHYAHISCLIEAAESQTDQQAKCPYCRHVFSLEEVPVPQRSTQDRQKQSQLRSLRSAMVNHLTLDEYLRNIESSLEELIKATGIETPELIQISGVELDKLRAMYRHHYNGVIKYKGGKIADDLLHNPLRGFIKTYNENGQLIKTATYGENGFSDSLNGVTKYYYPDAEAIETVIQYGSDPNFQGGYHPRFVQMYAENGRLILDRSYNNDGRVLHSRRFSGETGFLLRQVELMPNGVYKIQEYESSGSGHLVRTYQAIYWDDNNDHNVQLFGDVIYYDHTGSIAKRKYRYNQQNQVNEYYDTKRKVWIPQQNPLRIQSTKQWVHKQRELRVRKSMRQPRRF